jgi:hypothetical protein
MTKIVAGYRICLGRLRRSRLPVLLLALLRGLVSRLEAWLERPASSGALPVVAATDGPTAELAWRVDVTPVDFAAPAEAPAAPAPVTLLPPPRRPDVPPPLPRLSGPPRPTPASLRAAAANRPRRGPPPGLPRRMAR